MEELLVSVIVCTYNRAKYLEKCIESLQAQTHSKVEIIIVNGPSTDNTETILAKYQNIKIIHQKELNGLSYARNLGIFEATGEIVAFIDDDAIADRNWIKNLVVHYDNDNVGAVGGFVVFPDNKLVQFDNGIINKNGIPEPIRKNDLPIKKDQFRILMGTNCSFTKRILKKLGGFDPYFHYYHDESDMCVRVILAGYAIVYEKNAIVKHEMAEGLNRKSLLDMKWDQIIKNVIFFTLKNFGNSLRSYTTRPVFAISWWFWRFAFICFWKREITIKNLLTIFGHIIAGAVSGYRDGFFYHFGGFKKNVTIPESNLNKNQFIQQTHNFPQNSLNDKENKSFKIALLSQEYAKDCKGGICRYSYKLAKGLSDLGHEVHIISKSETGRDYEYIEGNVHVHKIKPQSIDFLGLPPDMTISKKNIAYSYAAFNKILDLIQKNGIQIVEAPLWDAEGFVFSLLKPVPLVIRIETPLFKVAEIEGWKITKDIKLANWLEGEPVRRADKVISISNAIGTYICDHHHVSKDKIINLPLGIKIPDISEISQKNNENEFNILFVGRLEKRKGIETLFRAIPGVLDKIQDATFIIVGSDTNGSPSGGSYKKYLLENLDRKYHSKVTFKGFVPDKELEGYYRSCDLFVAPSLYESFGLIYLEAMAWGKPVIGCNVGGVPEVIKNTLNGFLIPPEQPKALAEAIIQFHDPELRITIGSSARNYVEQNFTLSTMSEKTISIYRDLIV